LVGGEYDCITCAVEEHPNSGGYHIHVYLDSAKIMVINNHDFFDYCDHHPNIRPVRTTPHKAYLYVIKDNCTIFEDGTPPEEPEKKTRDDQWKEVCKATTREEFLLAAQEICTRDTVLHFSSIMAFADWKYKESGEEYEPLPQRTNYEDYPELADWMEKYIKSPYTGRPQSLVLIGDSKWGKTIWARSLGRHAYFPGLFMLEGFNPDVEYAVFDDLVNGLNTIPDYKHWLGGQFEFIVGDKYMRKRRIKWGKPAIYIANKDPRQVCQGIDTDWLETNCVFVTLREAFSVPLLE
jgi:hypothetical protein